MQSPRFAPEAWRTAVRRDTDFAEALRAALRTRGLPLDRVRARLVEQGMGVSLSTLSYWQSGRSQPERESSLRVVDALESILELPTGALRGLVGPHRPRGHPTDKGAVEAFRQAMGARSPVRHALGAEFCHLNQHVYPLLLTSYITLDETRSIASTSRRVVLRARRDGVDRWTVVHVQSETDSGPPEVRVRFGRLGSVRFLPDVRVTVAEILFGHTLRRHDTAVVEYDTVRAPSRTPATHYEQNLREGTRESLIHVTFHPSALPVTCNRYWRNAFESEPHHVHPTTLDTSFSAHMLAGRKRGPWHGISWKWP